MKNKKRVVSLALAGMLSMGMLTGCGSKDTQAEVSNDVEVVEDVKEIAEVDRYYFEQYYEVPEERVFEPGEHVFFIRYNYSSLPERVTSGRVDVPEGYEILEIENYTEHVGYGSQSSGVDIWYINNETVVVEPVYKDELRLDCGRNGFYDYANFGTVIKKDEDVKLTK